jgi:(+)-neomenthol dehydrogenase
MRTNYYGAKLVIEALLPLLQLSSSGRIVNVSSCFGLLRVSSVNLNTGK